jgi:hypothetical protein
MSTSSEVSAQPILNDLDWDESTEILLTEIADKALCYSWLYDKSYRSYKRSNQKLAIPVIVISTLIGAVTVSVSGYVPASYIAYTQAGIGGLSIFNGILGTLNTYFRYAELSESHLNASNGWAKLYRNISIELKLARSYRKDIDVFYRDCRRDYDRLMEMQLTIPKNIIDSFNAKFRKNHSLVKPEVCEGLKHTEAYMDGIDLKSAKEHILMVDTEDQPEATQGAIDEIQLIIAEERQLASQRAALEKRKREILEQAHALEHDHDDNNEHKNYITISSEQGLLNRPPLTQKDLLIKPPIYTIKNNEEKEKPIDARYEPPLSIAKKKSNVAQISEIKPGIVSSMIEKLSGILFQEDQSDDKNESKSESYEMEEVHFHSS